jgi:hypothetical protein
VPESNLVLAEKSGAPQHTQLNMPARFSPLSGFENARSVPCCRVTWYCSRGELLLPLVVGPGDLHAAIGIHVF